MKRTINKDEDLITTYGIYNGKNQKKDTFNIYERKMINYFIGMIQDKYLDKNVRNNIDRKNEIGILESMFKKNGVKRTFNGEESVEFDFSYSKIKKYLKLDNEPNSKIENILLSLKTKNIIYKFGNDTGVIKNIVSSISINTKLKSKEVFGCIYIDSEFLYVNLLYTHYTPLSLFDTGKLSSTYTIMLYEEMSRILNVGKYTSLSLRTLESMNEFLDSNLTKNDMDRVILRIKKELLREKIISFDYSFYRNPKKEWIFCIVNMTKIDLDSNIFDYVKDYIDFRLLNNQEQEEFKNIYSDKYQKILQNQNERDNNRTKHLQSKK